MSDIPFTIGVCAYNESNNIAKAINSIFEQKLEGFELKEVIVVSSASTDGTDEIVIDLAKIHPNVRLIRQEKRQGKNSAVNLILDSKSTEIIVIQNADNNYAADNSLRKLLEVFADPKNGMVGGHPIPLNDGKTFAGFASLFFWNMHHHIALISPKIGELVAYRDVGFRLPLHLQSDEDLVRLKVEEAGYRACYAPDALIYNRGPETIRDFIKQRTRVNIGQCYLQKVEGYYSPTWDKRLLYGAMVDASKELGYHPVKLMMTVFMEFYARIKAKLYVKFDMGDMNMWDPVETTKKL